MAGTPEFVRVLIEAEEAPLRTDSTLIFTGIEGIDLGFIWLIWS
jgi:hypothetical protein